MAVRARALTESDAAEWARYAERIVPLKGRAGVVRAKDAAVNGPAPDQPVRDTRGAASRAIGSPGGSLGQPPPLEFGGQPAGVDAATWRRFHRGKLGGARKLDLHGMTAQHAHAALRSFLRAAHADRLRCVEIVTGRGDGEGSGVLRRELPMWLNLPDIRPMVLGAAHPHTGNAMHARLTNPGSVRLLLRRPRG